MSSYGLQLVTAPTWEPLTVSEAKKQVEVSTSDSTHDDQLGRLIAEAREYVEERTGRAIATQTWDLFLDELPDEEEMFLPRAPLQSVTSFKYYDSNGTQQTWSSSNYIVSTSREPGRLSLAFNVSWPSVQYRPDAIVVRYVAGYTTPALVPGRLKRAMLLLVGHWFENREAVSPVDLRPVPMAVDALLEQCSIGDEFTNYAGEDA